MQISRFLCKNVREWPFFIHLICKIKLEWWNKYHWEDGEEVYPVYKFFKYVHLILETSFFCIITYLHNDTFITTKNLTLYYLVF